MDTQQNSGEYESLGQSQWPSVLRCRFSAARLLRLWFRILPRPWTSFCCECCVCVLSGRGLCNELITRPEESYRLWCVVVCDLETSWMRRTWLTGALAPKTDKQMKKILKTIFSVILCPWKWRIYVCTNIFQLIINVHSNYGRTIYVMCITVLFK
jgi:hypothetical protein